MAKEKVICGIQQVGIGVANVQEAWDWYRKTLGFDVKVVDDKGVAERMLPYTGGKPQPRHAFLVVNLRGGGGLEIWEPQERELKYLDYTPEFGDLGIFACKIKSRDVRAAYEQFKAQGENVLTEPRLSPAGYEHFFMRDPYGNLLEIEADGYCFIDYETCTGGNNGAIVGVSDMDKSIKFYGAIADYDKVIYDITDTFEDLKGLPGGEYKCRRVLLGRSKAPEGPLSEVLGTSHIELISRCFDREDILKRATDDSAEIKGIPIPRKLYEGRYWGDPGFIHLCFDVRNMDKVQESCEALGHKFVCDGGRDFSMGAADGHFTYVEDPDGALIEFVETFKIPVMKKWGLSLNLADKDDHKPLPRWMTKALRFLRSK